MKSWNVSSPPQLPAPTTNSNGLYPALAFILEETRRDLSTRGRQELSSGELTATLEEVAHRLGFQLASYERDLLLSHLEREQKTFGILQSLVDDIEVTDIIVSKYDKITIQRGRRNYKTSLSFASQQSFEAYVERLLLKAGTTYSTKQPITDGMIGSLARLHAVHKCIADEGPYLTIRLNRFDRIGVEDLVERGLAPQAILDYLSAVINAGMTVLIAGEVGTGKTTLVRALAGEIPLEESLLVIEDTQEIRLQHPHVRYLTTREENAEGVGRVSPSFCIRAGMRMAMNRIIFGEIRDAEAAESFIDVCASGHPGMSTIHARSAAEAVARLELFLGRSQPGVGRAVLSDQVVTAVQVIVHVAICKATGARRVTEVREIGPVADGTIRHRTIFQYKPQGNVPTWQIPTRVSAHKEAIESMFSLSALPSTLRL